MEELTDMAKPHDTASRGRAARRAIYAAAFVAIGAQGFYYATHVPYGIPPDEVAHVSYVVHLQETGRLLPDYERRYLYLTDGTKTDRLNHLSHPPFYYHLLRPFIPRDPAAIMPCVTRLRLLNLLIALLGVGLFFAVGARRKGLPLAFHLYYAAAMTAVPMLPYLAGSVNNDNLVLLGGGLAVWGAMLLVAESPPAPRGLLYLGAGLTLSMLTKATAGLHVLLFSGLILGYRLWKDRGPAVLRTWHLVATAAVLLIPLVYYATVYREHGTFAPDYGTLGYQPADPPVIYGFVRYVGHFVYMLAASWTGIFSHRNVLKYSWFETWPLLIPVALAGLGLFWRERQGAVEESDERFFAILRMAVVAGLLFMAVHFVWVYAEHQIRGYPGGIQARYYFALMPPALMLSFRPWLSRACRPFLLPFLAAMLFGFACSGLFYYLLVVG